MAAFRRSPRACDLEGTEMKKRHFVEAIGRNPGEDLISHLYEDFGDYYLPMCRKGWNRSNGAGFSIFRGHSGLRGLCKDCEKNRRADWPAKEAIPGSHKTKYQ